MKVYLVKYATNIYSNGSSNLTAYDTYGINRTKIILERQRD